MATLAELQTVVGNGEMIAKVKSAMLKKAKSVLDETSPTLTADRLAWARRALVVANDDEAAVLWRYVVAANASATVAQILGAADSAIETNVNAAVDKFWPTGA